MAPPFGEGATAADDREHPETVPSSGGDVASSALTDRSEFAAVILAATPGARLFPLTATDDDDDDDDHDFELVEEDDGDAAMGVAADGGGEGTKDGEDEGGTGTTKKDVRAPPKHLLPLGGEPILCRLLRAVRESGMSRAVVAISSEDDLTVEAMEATGGCSARKAKSDEKVSATATEGDEDEDGNGGGTSLAASLTLSSDIVTKGGKGGSSSSSSSSNQSMSISVIRLPSSCSGSADALRRVNSGGHLPPSSHAVVLPGDLVLASHLLAEAENPLGMLADAHRRNCGYDPDGSGGAEEPAPPAAVTMLLADVGDEDEAGLPLKESAKAKKGGLARDEEDIEFIGLSPLPVSSAHQPSRPRRVVVKSSKTEVEEDEDLTGSTPKLIVPKASVRRCCSASSASVSVRTDLSDLHVYCLSPWVLTLLSARPGIVSLQTELIPLLVGRQFRGAKSAFGSRALDRPGGPEALESILTGAPFRAAVASGDDVGGGGVDESVRGARRASGSALDAIPAGAGASAPRCPFSVSAQVLSRGTSKLTLRACTVPAYLYSCRETVATAVRPPSTGGAAAAAASSKKKVAPPSSPSASKFLPEGTTVQSKVGSALLPGSEIGDKVKVQSSTVGRRSKLGNRCRLNNVVVMDDVIVGDNTVLQNSVLGAGSTVGENCNLNDCQVGPGAVVPPGTKDKGETFMR